MATSTSPAAIFCSIPRTKLRTPSLPSLRTNLVPHNHPLRPLSLRVQSCSSVGASTADDEAQRARKCLQELAETLILPPGYLSKLPKDLKVDLNDAAFALSSGPLKEDCGERVADLVMGLCRAWEQADTQTTSALAKDVPSIQDFLPRDPSANAALGKRMQAAGRYLALTGEYGNGELQKLSKALLAAGEVLCLSSPSSGLEPPPKPITRSFKFGDLQVQITAQKAYIGAAIACTFGLLSWALTTSLQSINADPAQYANENSFLVATSLRTTLLTGGYFCSALSFISMMGLFALGGQLGPEDKS